MRDKLFNSNSDISDFRFDESVVAVFDDMVKRSVPGYEAMIQMVGLVARTYGQRSHQLLRSGVFYWSYNSCFSSKQ